MCHHPWECLRFVPSCRTELSLVQKQSRVAHAINSFKGHGATTHSQGQNGPALAKLLFISEDSKKVLLLRATDDDLIL